MWGNFKTWFEARQLRVQQIRNAEVTPPQGNGAPNPEGDLVAGSEFNGEGIRMNEQPFEGRTGPREGEVNTGEGEVNAETTTIEEPAKTDIETPTDIEMTFDWNSLEPNVRSKLSGANFQNVDFSKKNVRGVIFDSCNFKNSNLQNGFFADASFIKCNFENAMLSGAFLENVMFGVSNFKNADLSKARLKNTHFGLADLQGTNFSGADLENANFLNAKNVNQANFTGCDLSTVRFLA